MRPALRVALPRRSVVVAAPWVAFGTVLLVSLLTLGPDLGPDPRVLLTGLGLVALALVAQVLVGMSGAPRRRPALVALLVGLLLWLTGAASLAASGASAPVPFPAPGELVFLAAYASLAAFVFMDGQSSRALRSVEAWADAVLLVGGIVAMAALVILGPLASLSVGSEVAMVVAVGFPLLNVGLAVIVVGQWALGMRPWDGRSMGLCGSFLLMAAAEVSLYLAMTDGGYGFSVLSDALWGVALILLVQSGCAPRRPFVGSAVRHVPPPLLVGGFVASVLVLVSRPDGPGGLVAVAGAGLVVAAAAVRVGGMLADGRRAAGSDAPPPHDPATRLPSRAAFTARLAADLAAGERVGILLLDIAHLEEITEAFGPAAGDELLHQVGEAVCESLPASAFAASFGDGIAVLVHSDDEVVLGELARAVRSAVPSTVDVEDVRVSVRVRVGVTTSRRGPRLPETMLAAAATAVGKADAATDGVAFVGGDAAPRPRRRLQMASELRSVLRSGGLDVWYQPVVLAATGSVDRWEALVRWNHPREGMVPPALFLPLARREGLMLELSLQVASRVAADLVEWRRSGLQESVSLNVAPPELLGGVLLPEILQVWMDRDLPAQSLTVELTEEVFDRHPEAARQVLVEARRTGIALSIDHYGAGFSSLAYLRDLPVSEVKLDRTFFAGVCTDARSAVIVQSTVTMAHALGMSVVAEGIETEDVATRAIVLGVDRIQGYWVSQPLPAIGVPMLARQRALRIPEDP